MYSSQFWRLEVRDQGVGRVGFSWGLSLFGLLPVSSHGLPLWECICRVSYPSFFKIYVFIYLFIGLHWVFVAVRGLSLVVASGGYSLLWCACFSFQWLLLLQTQALGARASVVASCRLSSCGSWALERRLSSCGAQALLLCDMWDLPGPGIEPVSPALASGFLTIVPPGKSPLTLLVRTIVILD